VRCDPLKPSQISHPIFNASRGLVLFFLFRIPFAARGLRFFGFKEDSSSLRTFDVCPKAGNCPAPPYFLSLLFCPVLCKDWKLCLSLSLWDSLFSGVLPRLGIAVTLAFPIHIGDVFYDILLLRPCPPVYPSNLSGMSFFILLRTSHRDSLSHIFFPFFRLSPRPYFCDNILFSFYRP